MICLLIISSLIQPTLEGKKEESETDFKSVQVKLEEVDLDVTEDYY